MHLLWAVRFFRVCALSGERYNLLLDTEVERSSLPVFHVSGIAEGSGTWKGDRARDDWGQEGLLEQDRAYAFRPWLCLCNSVGAARLLPEAVPSKVLPADSHKSSSIQDTSAAIGDNIPAVKALTSIRVLSHCHLRTKQKQERNRSCAQSTPDQAADVSSQRRCSQPRRCAPPPRCSRSSRDLQYSTLSGQTSLSSEQNVANEHACPARRTLQPLPENVLELWRSSPACDYAGAGCGKAGGREANSHKLS